MTAIILAAGFSRRFGKEKLLMNIENKPIIVHVIDLVLSMGFKETILVYRNEEIKRAAAGRRVKCVHNAKAVEGISSSIICGVRNSEPTDAYIFFMGDQPFIDAGTVNRLLDAFLAQKGSIIIPRYGGCNGNPVIFASSWKNELESLTGDAGGRTIIKENPDRVYFVDIPDTKAGRDIDTWEDYQQQNGGI